MDSGLSTLLEHIAPRAELLVYSALILAIGLVLAAIARSATFRLLQRLELLHVRPSPEATLVITRVVRSVVLALAVIVMLNFWGLGLGGIWSGMLGLLAGIGVALIATWALVSNMTGALFLAIWGPYRLGDTFELLPEGIKGRAVDRNMMFTVLRQDDGAIISIPNNLIFQRIVRIYPATESAGEDVPPLPEREQGP